MPVGTPADQGKRRQKGPRPKHIPQRMCIVCRDRTAKRALTRIVRTPEGAVEIDPTGKRNGRGAYLCDSPACWERALACNALAHALKTDIDAETAGKLRRHASALPGPTAETGSAAEEGQDSNE